jgi:hypothetical protein
MAKMVVAHGRHDTGNHVSCRGPKAWPIARSARARCRPCRVSCRHDTVANYSQVQCANWGNVSFCRWDGFSDDGPARDRRRPVHHVPHEKCKILSKQKCARKSTAPNSLFSLFCDVPRQTVAHGFHGSSLLGTECLAPQDCTNHVLLSEELKTART